MTVELAPASEEDVKNRILKDLVVKFDGPALLAPLPRAMVFGLAKNESLKARAFRWQQYLCKWRVEGLLPARFELQFKDDELCITALVRTRDVRTGFRVEIEQSRILEGEPEPLHIRDLLRDIYMHELDEQIFVDDVQVFHPHAMDGVLRISGKVDV